MNDPNEEMQLVYTLEPAVSEGWVVISVVKWWVNSKMRNSTDDYQVGATLVPPAGKEILIAIPLVSNPEEQPEGTITLDQLETVVFKSMIDVSRATLKNAAQPIKL